MAEDLEKLLQHAHDLLSSNSSASTDDLLEEAVELLNASREETGRGPRTHGSTLDNTLLIFAYSVLSVIAIFGNSTVCYVILKNQRLHTPTNFFLANLAVSDLLVTCLNVPFNILRHIMYDWPFGEALCHLNNFSLMVSTYVSTYTLTAIALDRHRVVLKPLSRRMSKTLAGGLLVLIWVLAVLLSLPFGVYTTVQRRSLVLEEDGEVVVDVVRRCRNEFPAPEAQFGQYLTVATFLLQYCVPLTLIGVAYGRIVQSLWSRRHVGAVTANQQQSQARAKRKSIKLLIAVVVVFALCWLPLNLYHLLTDLHPHPEVFQYNMKAFFACHWIAISSTCYNPFVYCWLNEHFREEVRARFACCRRCGLRCWPLHAIMGGHNHHCHRNGDRRSRGTDDELRGSRPGSARAASGRRGEVTLITDPDDLLQSCLKAANGSLLDEEVDLLSLHRNGHVEFHVTRLHKCVRN